MPRYVNTRTGNVVDVPEEPTTRLNRPGRRKQWAAFKATMDKSTRWRRVDDATEVQDGVPDTGDTTGGEGPSYARGGDDSGLFAADPGPTDPPPDPAEEPDTEASNSDAGEVDTTKVREWAREQGIEVSERGRLPFAVIDQYKAANG